MEKQKENGTLVRLRKKIMQGVLGCLFAVGVMLLLPGTEIKAQAAEPEPDFIQNGIKYNIYFDNETCYISGYNSTAGTEVHIPAEITFKGKNYRVTAIEDGAFKDAPFKKITLEEGLLRIRIAAFENTSLTEIEIPASAIDIYSLAFSGSPLTKITFRGKTPPKYLKSDTFKGISGPITIEIPQGADANDWETALRSTGLDCVFTIQTYNPSSASSSSTPVEQSSETAEGEQVNRIPEHVCQYEWETVHEAGAGQDGLERYLCKLCGDVQATLIIPAAQYQVQELYTKVTGAATGETVTYDMGQIHTVCDKLFTKLQQRSDVTLILTYQYKGTDYQTTFPARADYTELLEDEEQFYGMLGLNGRCGIVTE